MQTIQAVHTKDVEKYLNSLGVLNLVKEGECFCSECGSKITLENFSAVYPKDGNVNFICGSISCYENVVNRISK